MIAIIPERTALDKCTMLMSCVHQPRRKCLVSWLWTELTHFTSSQMGFQEGISLIWDEVYQNQGKSTCKQKAVTHSMRNEDSMPIVSSNLLPPMLPSAYPQYVQSFPSFLLALRPLKKPYSGPPPNIVYLYSSFYQSYTYIFQHDAWRRKRKWRQEMEWQECKEIDNRIRNDERFYNGGRVPILVLASLNIGPPSSWQPAQTAPPMK